MNKCPECLLPSENHVLRCGCGHEFYKVDRESVQRSTSSSGAWFYWIAGLSIVNSLLSLFDAHIQFLIGLERPWDRL